MHTSTGRTYAKLFNRALFHRWEFDVFMALAEYASDRTLHGTIDGYAPAPSRWALAEAASALLEIEPPSLSRGLRTLAGFELWAVACVRAEAPLTERRAGVEIATVQVNRAGLIKAIGTLHRADLAGLVAGKPTAEIGRKLAERAAFGEAARVPEKKRR